MLLAATQMFLRAWAWQSVGMGMCMGMMSFGFVAVGDLLPGRHMMAAGLNQLVKSIMLLR